MGNNGFVGCCTKLMGAQPILSYTIRAVKTTFRAVNGYGEKKYAKIISNYRIEELYSEKV